MVPTPGCSGPTTQLNDFFVGTYDQGLVFTALKAAGQTANAAAISWLTSQECPSGGWAFPNQAIGGCAEDPSSFEGADDQSTSLAVQGLDGPGCAHARGRRERAVLLHERTGRRRWLGLLPQLGGCHSRPTRNPPDS